MSDEDMDVADVLTCGLQKQNMRRIQQRCQMKSESDKVITLLEAHFIIGRDAGQPDTVSLSYLDTIKAELECLREELVKETRSRKALHEALSSYNAKELKGEK